MSDVIERIERGISKLTITKLSDNAPAYLRAREQEIELLRLAKLGKQSQVLEQYAELGRLILKACEERFNKENKCWNLDSLSNIYELFCQKRAELLKNHNNNSTPVIPTNTSYGTMLEKFTKVV